MANHPSALKRKRSSETKRLQNRTRKTAVRDLIKKIRASKDKKSAAEQLLKVTSLLDKLAKTNLIHKNKAANLKSKLTRHVNALK